MHTYVANAGCSVDEPEQIKTVKTGVVVDKPLIIREVHIYVRIYIKV